MVQKSTLSLLALCLLLAVGWFVYRLIQDEAVVPESLFTYRNASADNITVSKPVAHEVVTHNFTVEGKARGGWYFEASFPIEVTSSDGKVLATAVGHAQGEWMTELFVPFNANIQISSTYHGPATIVLKKDNPSGISEKDGSLSFSVNVE